MGSLSTRQDIKPIFFFCPILMQSQIKSIGISSEWTCFTSEIAFIFGWPRPLISNHISHRDHFSQSNKFPVSEIKSTVFSLNIPFYFIKYIRIWKQSVLRTAFHIEFKQAMGSGSLCEQRYTNVDQTNISLQQVWEVFMYLLIISGLIFCV